MDPVISSIISGLALILSVFVFFKNQLYTNTTIMMHAQSLIFERKDAVLKAEEDLAVLGGIPGDSLSVQSEATYNDTIHSFLAACDSACEKYYWFRCSPRSRKSFISFSKTHFVNDVKKYSVTVPLDNFTHLAKYMALITGN